MALNPVHIALLLAASAASLIISISENVGAADRFDFPFWAREAVASTTADRRPYPIITLDLAPDPLPEYQPVASLPEEDPTPTATPLPPPTATPVPTAIPTEVPAANPVTAQPVPGYVELTGLRHEWQTWNNCGPATLAANLSYYGSPLTQADIGGVLRQFPDDKNVSPHELESFARSQGFHAQVRAGGSSQLLRAFLDNGIPILIETWLEESPNDGMGHYRLITGYNDAVASWFAYDSYVHTNLVSTDPANYRGIYMPYEETDQLWAVFNRTYILVYPPEKQAVVEAILGATIDTNTMWQQAYAQTEAELAQRPDDPFLWFNLGTNLVELGDYAGAAAAYDRARAIGLPWRMLWYQFNIFEAYHAVGRHQDVITLADSTLAIAVDIEELHYWKGQALAALGDMNGAVASWQRALQLNPTFAEARLALENGSPRS